MCGASTRHCRQGLAWARALAALTHTLLAAALCASPASPATVVVIDENFNDISDWDDLTKAVTWDGHGDPTSGFKTSGGVLRLSRSGSRSTVGYTGYSSSDDLKTFTALDRRFPTPIPHATSTVTIDFRARWDKLDNSGEKGRFVVILIYDYPPGGLDMDLDDKYDDFDQEWWGRPSYHLRVRSAGTGSSQGTTLLQYGGGYTDLGEIERYQDKWWLAGFISGAGGICPGCGPDFPDNSWTRTATGLATIQFRDYRYVIREDQQEIWFDADDDGFEGSELEAVMPLPASSSAPLYRYFDTFEGIRLYWRGAGSPGSSGDPGQVYLDHITVTAELEGEPPPDPDVPAQTPWGLVVLSLLLIALVSYRIWGGHTLTVGR